MTDAILDKVYAAKNQADIAATAAQIDADEAFARARAISVAIDRNDYKRLHALGVLTGEEFRAVCEHRDVSEGVCMDCGEDVSDDM